MKIGLILTIIGILGIRFTERSGTLFWLSFIPFAVGFYAVLLIVWKRDNDKKLRKFRKEYYNIRKRYHESPE